MRLFAALLLVIGSLGYAFGQNEQAPIIERDIVYKDWSYKSIQSDETINLRNYTKGKKLVMVVYFAPWCGNWRHDAPILQRLYDKYKSHGLGIIAVGEYDPVPAMKTNLDTLKVTFPAVYESENRTEKQNTLHYNYRKSTGDNRNWGSPWYILLSPKTMEPKGDVLTRHTFVINGEIIEPDGEKFIREKLGLPAAEMKAISGSIEACDADAKIADLKKPE